MSKKIVMLLLILTACNHQKSEFMLDVQGHRGCRGLLPENTIPAFRKAIELGVTTLELDLAVSKDHLLVVSHEPFMNHEIVTHPSDISITKENERSFNLYQMNYEEIKQFDVGLKTHPRFPDQEKMKAHKPLLTEVFQLAETETSRTILYNIEIKSHPSYDDVFSPKVGEFARMLVDLVQERNLEDQVTIQSFDLRALETAYQMNPSINTALLVDEHENIDSKLEQLSFRPTIISPYYELLDKHSIDRYQGEGYKIIPWTANEIDTMKQLISIGVDGIITDYPDRLFETLRN